MQCAARAVRLSAGVHLSLLVFALAGFSVAPAQESERLFSFGVEPDFNSRYVWRGMAQGDGPVCQPSAWVSAAGFTFSGWSNVSLGRVEDQPRFNELDLNLAYSGELGELSFDPSAVCYLYPGQPDAPATAELGLALACPVGPLEVFTDHSVDLLEYRGAYFGDLGLGYEHELSPVLGAGASVYAGLGSAKFNETYAGVSRTALNVLGADLSLTWSVLDLFYLRPHLGASLVPDRELKKAAGTPTQLCFGLAAGMEF